MAVAFWGKRCTNSYAWKSVHESGTQLIFGSDAPVESPNPFLGLHAAVLRKHLDENSRHDLCWIPNQCLGLQSSLNAFISTPSIVGGFGKLTGKILNGYAADLVLLPSNFLAIDNRDIQFANPLATMVGGKWVYKNDNIDIEIN
jgi:predicted amidohydrolase YtcJ